MKENFLWRCPNCDTLNSTDICVACGEKRPLNKPVSADEAISDAYNSGRCSGYAEARKELAAQYSRKRNVWAVIALIMLLISIVSSICLIFYSNSKPTLSEKNITMNSNAQIVYKAALDYCIECCAKGNRVEDGIFVESFVKKDADVTFDGSHSDIKNYFNCTIGQDTKFYFCILFKNGTPQAAAWRMEPFNTEVETITSDTIIEQDQKIGIYPPFGEISQK